MNAAALDDTHKPSFDLLSVTFVPFCVSTTMHKAPQQVAASASNGKVTFHNPRCRVAMQGAQGQTTRRRPNPESEEKERPHGWSRGNDTCIKPMTTSA